MVAEAEDAHCSIRGRDPRASMVEVGNPSTTSILPPRARHLPPSIRPASAVPDPARPPIVATHLHRSNLVPALGQTLGEVVPTPRAVPRAMDKQDAGHADALAAMLALGRDNEHGGGYQHVAGPARTTPLARASLADIVGADVDLSLGDQLLAIGSRLGLFLTVLVMPRLARTFCALGPLRPSVLESL
jgi:hypothetical protein